MADYLIRPKEPCVADVLTPSFMLSSATLMLAPYGTDPFSLTPALNSVGMVSDVSVMVENSATELMNGVAQAIVDSRKTGSKTKITANVFEYTAQNLLTAMSLSSQTPVVTKVGTLTSAAASAAVSLSLQSSSIPGAANSALTVATDIPAGATLILQHPTITDLVFPTRSSGAATLASTTFTVPIAAPYAIPASMSFPIGTTVWVVTEMPMGTNLDYQLFSCKISGTLTNFSRPVTYIAPKVKVIKGLEVKFTEKAYSSMAWDIEPYLLGASEVVGRLAEIGTTAPGRLYLGG